MWKDKEGFLKRRLYEFNKETKGGKDEKEKICN